MSEKPYDHKSAMMSAAYERRRAEAYDRSLKVGLDLKAAFLRAIEGHGASKLKW